MSKSMPLAHRLSARGALPLRPGGGGGGGGAEAREVLDALKCIFSLI